MKRKVLNVSHFRIDHPMRSISGRPEKGDYETRERRRDARALDRLRHGTIGNANVEP